MKGLAAQAGPEVREDLKELLEDAKNTPEKRELLRLLEAAAKEPDL